MFTRTIKVYWICPREAKMWIIFKSRRKLTISFVQIIVSKKNPHRIFTVEHKNAFRRSDRHSSCFLVSKFFVHLTVTALKFGCPGLISHNYRLGCFFMHRENCECFRLNVKRYYHTRGTSNYNFCAV